MRNESINTAEGTTASDPSSLPVPLEPPVIKRQPSHLAESRGTSLCFLLALSLIPLKQAI